MKDHLKEGHLNFFRTTLNDHLITLLTLNSLI